MGNTRLRVIVHNNLITLEEMVVSDGCNSFVCVERKSALHRLSNVRACLSYAEDRSAI